MTRLRTLKVLAFDMCILAAVILAAAGISAGLAHRGGSDCAEHHAQAHAAPQP